MTTTLASSIWDEYVSTADLTALGRTAYEEMYTDNTLLPYFPTLNVQGLEYEFQRGFQALSEAATFRSFDAPPTLVGSTTGVGKVSGQLPPIAEQERLSEIHILKSRNASNERLRREVLDMGVRLTGRIRTRMEMLMAKAVEYGAYSIEENGISTGSIDFGRDADLTFTVSTLWSDPAADIPTQLIDLQQRMTDLGTGVGVLKMPMALRTLMLTHPSMKAFGLPPTTADQLPQLDLAQLSVVLDRIGLTNVRVETYDRKVDVRDNTGAVTKVRALSENKVIALPSTPVGRGLFGETAEAGEFGPSEIGQNTTEGIIVYGEKAMKPVNYYVATSAIGIPTFMDGMANTTAAVQVLA